MIQAYSPSTYPRRPAKVGKTIEKWILYLAVLGIAGVSLYWFVIGKGKTFEVSLVAKTGTVEYRESEKEGWKTINNLPLKINISTEIRTLTDSEASFSVGDGSKMQLGSYSRIVLAGNQGEVNWVQTDGNTHHQTAKNADRKSYKVSISDGVIESQGTAFEVKIKETDTTILALKDQITITYKDKSTASAKAGEEILINPVGRKINEIEEQELREEWTLNNLKKDRENNLAIDEKVLAKAGLSTNTTDTADNETEQPPAIQESTEEKPTEAEKKPSETAGQSDISLQVKESSNGVLLSWTGGQGDRESWKILKGTGSDLTYPNDSYRTVSKDESSYLWEVSGDSNTYNYRVCAYRNDGGCVGYSNTQNISVSGNTTTNSASSTTENTSSTESTPSQNTDTTKKSGTTTRKQCENSGGHWTKATELCKCPVKEVFVSSVGRCQKK